MVKDKIDRHVKYCIQVSILGPAILFLTLLEFSQKKELAKERVFKRETCSIVFPCMGYKGTA